MTRCTFRVAKSLELFNRDSLMEIDVLYAPDAPEAEVVAQLRRTLQARHGREDFRASPRNSRCSMCSARCSMS